MLSTCSLLAGAISQRPGIHPHFLRPDIRKRTIYVTAFDAKLRESETVSFIQLIRAINENIADVTEKCSKKSIVSSVIYDRFTDFDSVPSESIDY